MNKVASLSVKRIECASKWDVPILGYSSATTADFYKISIRNATPLDEAFIFELLNVI